jgi:hypothetical protein
MEAAAANNKAGIPTLIKAFKEFILHSHGGFAASV